jgi:hypothetical protein
MNSVVLGTSANSVTPRNFSGTPEPSSTTSTSSTSTSATRVAPRRQSLGNLNQKLGNIKPARTSNQGIEDCARQQDARALCPTPIGRIVTPMMIMHFGGGWMVTRYLPNMRGWPPAPGKRALAGLGRLKGIRDNLHCAVKVLLRHSLRKLDIWHIMLSFLGRVSGSPTRIRLSVHKLL